MGFKQNLYQMVLSDKGTVLLEPTCLNACLTSVLTNSRSSNWKPLRQPSSSISKQWTAPLVAVTLPKSVEQHTSLLWWTRLLGTNENVLFMALTCISNPCADGEGPCCTRNLLPMGDFQGKLQWGQHGRWKGKISSWELSDGLPCFILKAVESTRHRITLLWNHHGKAVVRNGQWCIPTAVTQLWRTAAQRQKHQDGYPGQAPSQSLHLPSAACLPSHSTPPAPAAACGSPRRASRPSAAPAPRWQRRRVSAAGLAASGSGQPQGLAVGARSLGAEGQRWPVMTWGCAAGPAAAGRVAGIVGCGKSHIEEALEPHALGMLTGAFT